MMSFLITGFESIAPRLGMTLVHSLWQGAVAAILLSVALRLLWDKSATLRHSAACGAMALFVLTVVVTFAAVTADQPLTLPVAADMTPPPVMVTARRAVSAPQVPSPQVDAAPVVPWVDSMRWAGFGWLIGATAVAIWHLAGWMWVRRFARGIGGRELDSGAVLGRLAESLGIRRAVRLVESGRLNVPAVVGVFRPVILIPLGFLSDLPPDHVEAILIHELAHIRRHDYLVNLLQVVVESLLFYHPATWWMSAQIRREREHCCDDIAASRFTPNCYVTALLALEQRRWPTANALVAATGGTLLGRVQRLLGRDARSRHRPVRSALAATMVIACICLPVVMQGCDKSKPSGPSTLRATAPSAPVPPSLSAASGITDEDLKPDQSIGRIGVSDLVEVHVQDLVGTNVETSLKSTVDPDGMIALPLLPRGVLVRGLTGSEAQSAVATAYEDAKIIKNAQISVTDLEPRSQTYTVLGGGVAEPGEFQITSPNNRLTEALVCGKVDLDRQTTILISRKTKDGGTRTLKIPVAGLMAGDARDNIFMRPGDVVMLPPISEAVTTSPAAAAYAAAVDRGHYYVGGNQVSRDGTYAIPAGTITLKQAIIAAGGADDGFVSVLRRDGQKESLIIQNAPLADLLSGAMADVIVHPGDTITVSASAQQWQGATTQQAVTP